MTGTLVELLLLRKLVPMQAGMGVMLEMVAVVEEEEVVEAAIVAGGAAGMFVAALQPAKAEAEEVGGDVATKKESRRGPRDCGPEKEKTECLDEKVGGEVEFSFAVGGVSENA